MGNKKRDSKFEPFEGKSKTGRHIRLTASMLQHRAWKELKPIGFKLYALLKTKYAGIDRGIEFECTYKEILQKTRLVDDSTKKAFDDLIRKGFIEVVENNRSRMKANKYKFSSKWQHYGEPEFEYIEKKRKAVIHKINPPDSS